MAALEIQSWTTESKLQELRRRAAYLNQIDFLAYALWAWLFGICEPCHGCGNCVQSAVSLCLLSA